MDDGTDAVRSFDRRRFLCRAAGLAGGAGLLGAASGRSAGAGPSLTVMTRNLYLGVDLGGLFEADSTVALRELASDLLTEARRHPYGTRMDAVAAEIDATRPAVVGLQEAVRIRERPRDGDSSDWTWVADLLDRLGSALDERGLAYEVAASTVTTDVRTGAETDDGRVTLQLTDRDALLVRGDLAVADTRSGRYDTGLTVPLPGGDGTSTLKRGYCTATVEVADAPVTVANTHLEAASAVIRRLQAEELLARLPSEGRVVLAGDFNSGAGADTDTYDRLTDTFADAWATVRPDAAGETCCQRSSLRNDRSRLDSRVDGVLYRGALHPETVDRVGADPDDRVAVERDGESFRVWPSDHAGVVATFALDGVPTATPAGPSSTPSPASDPGSPAGPTRTGTDVFGDGTSSDSGPGFGVLAAVAGVTLGVLARWRRDRS